VEVSLFKYIGSLCRIANLTLNGITTLPFQTYRNHLELQKPIDSACGGVFPENP